MITHNDLAVNRILYTKDGSRMGNAIVTKVDIPRGGSSPSLGILFGSGTTYDLLSDYGNTVNNANLNQINNQFTLGPMAEPDHKHYTKPKIIPLDWKKLVDFVTVSTNRPVDSLDSGEASTLIAEAWNKYAHSHGIREEGQPVWRQGLEVHQTEKTLGGLPTRMPFTKGDPKDYL